MEEAEKISNYKQKVKQPKFVELEVPFSAGPYYDFLDAFLLGVKLETYFSYSKECINAIVYFLDDTTYLNNNITLAPSFDHPLMNFTRLVAGNFTHTIP